MDRKKYEKNIISMLTPMHKIQYYLNKNRKHILHSLINFHQSVIFAEDTNYYEILKQDYENYISSDGLDILREFVEFNKEHSEKVCNMRKSGEYYKTHYYLKALKFENYRCISKHVKTEFKYYIKASNNGIYGRIPVLKKDEKKIVNEAFRLLQYHYLDYCGLCSKHYYNSPFVYISHQEMVTIYEELLGKYRPK